MKQNTTAYALLFDNLCDTDIKRLTECIRSGFLIYLL